MLFIDKKNMLSLSNPSVEVHNGTFEEIENGASVEVEMEFVSSGFQK